MAAAAAAAENKLGDIMAREAGGKRESIPIKIGSNENPYGPSPMAVAAMVEDATMSYRYSHVPRAEMMRLLAEKEGVPEGHICLASGSGQVLRFYADYLSATTDLTGGNVVSSKPSYLRFTQAMTRHGCESRTVALNEEMTDDLPALAARIDDNTKAVYVCNPNNPTGVTVRGDGKWCHALPLGGAQRSCTTKFPSACYPALPGAAG